jgi:hypothetical protein
MESGFACDGDVLGCINGITCAKHGEGTITRMAQDVGADAAMLVLFQGVDQRLGMRL